MWHYTCPVVEGAKWVAQKFKGARLAWLCLLLAQVVQALPRLTASLATPGFESFTAHEHRARGLWKSTTPTDSGTATDLTHAVT